MRDRSFFGTYQEFLRPHAPHGVLGDDDRERRPEPPAEQLLEIVLPRGRARQHHRRVLALDLRVGVVHRVAISVPGRLADVDEAHQPIGRLVEPARAERRAVAAFMHGSEQAGEHDAMQQHRRQHEDRAVGEIDHEPADPDGGEMAAEMHEADPVVAPRQRFAGLLVDQLERIERHIPAQHGQPPFQRAGTHIPRLTIKHHGLSIK